MQFRGRRRRFGGGRIRLGQFELPLVVGVLVILTFVLSVTAAILGRTGVPLASYGLLVPPLVWQGQVWRLVTWQFFELEPIGLIFSCALLYWFGRDLCESWGARKFLAVYFGFVALIGALVCLIGRFLWSDVWAEVYFGTWPIAEALTIAWASLFPDRQILFFFAIRAQGKVLIALTIGATALWAAFAGFSRMVPHFLAELMMLVYVGQLRRLYLTWRLSRLQQQKKRYVANVIRLDREEDRGDGPPDKPRFLN
jgi:membrane associated rhomboid family serine protease